MTIYEVVQAFRVVFSSLSLKDAKEFAFNLPGNCSAYVYEVSANGETEMVLEYI